ncbi:MAG: hypothetical protein Q9164_005020 [Protoblastenia rupestris]
MNGLSTTAEGVNAALSAVADLVAAGGPTLNLKMTSEKTAPAPSPAPSLAQSTSPNQPAAASAKERKKNKKNKKDTLYHARENYKSSQRAFLESQKLYLELERKDKIANDEFNEIQLQLQRLCREDVSIEQTMNILSRCIQNLTKFQGHILHLRRFFAHIHEHISTIGSTYVVDFLDSADKLAQLPSTSLEQEKYERRQAYYLEVRIFTYYRAILVLFRRLHGIGAINETTQTSSKYPCLRCVLKEIRHDAHKVRSSYIVAGEFAATYLQISEKHILPGVAQVNRLMVQITQDNRMNVADKVKKINGYARKAQSEVSQLATERRERVREKLWDVDRRVKDVGKVIDQYSEIGEGDDLPGIGDGEEGAIGDEQTVGDDDMEAAMDGIDEEEEEEEEDEEDEEWDDLDE